MDGQTKCGVAMQGDINLAIKTNQYCNVDDPWKYANLKKADKKGHIWYDSFYMKYPE